MVSSSETELANGESVTVTEAIRGDVAEAIVNPGGEAGRGEASSAIQSYELTVETGSSGNFSEVDGSPVSSTSTERQEYVVGGMESTVRITVENTGVQTGTVAVIADEVEGPVSAPAGSNRQVLSMKAANLQLSDGPTETNFDDVGGGKALPNPTVLSEPVNNPDDIIYDRNKKYYGLYQQMKYQGYSYPLGLAYFSASPIFSSVTGVYGAYGYQFLDYASNSKEYSTTPTGTQNTFTDSTQVSISGGYLGGGIFSATLSFTTPPSTAPQMSVSWKLSGLSGDLASENNGTIFAGAFVTGNRVPKITTSNQFAQTSRSMQFSAPFRPGYVFKYPRSNLQTKIQGVLPLTDTTFSVTQQIEFNVSTGNTPSNVQAKARFQTIYGPGTFRKSFTFPNL